MSCNFCFDCIFPEPICAKANSSTSTKKPTAEKTSFDKTVGEIEGLINVYYPKAKIKKNNQKLEIIYKCRKLDDSTGTGRQIMTPQLDGILLTMELKDGSYKSNQILPSRINEILYVSILMAPYSKQEKKHLLTRMLIPHNTPEEFIRQFQSALLKFEQGKKQKKPAENISKETDNKESSTKKEQVASGEDPKETTDPKNPKSPKSPIKKLPTEDDSKANKVQKAVKTEKEKESPNKVSSKSPKKSNIDFGGSKLSKYTFQDGKFQIRLPGQPNARAKQGKKMKFVEYLYTEPMGSYKIGYTALDKRVSPREQENLLTNLITGMAKATGGKAYGLSSLPWQGYSGRQVEVKEIPGDGFKNARLRIFLVDRYLYVIQAKGSQAWLNSPGVEEVLSSLVFRP